MDTTPGPVPMYRALKKSPPQLMSSPNEFLNRCNCGSTTVFSTTAPVELAPPTQQGRWSSLPSPSPAFPPRREWSRTFSTSTTESTICGSELWRRGTTDTQSTICSTVRRKTRSCGPDTADSRSGRDPAAGTSSTSRESTQCLPPGEGVAPGTWP